MKPEDEHRMNDEFGYQRFALIELGYDLINSLIGIYVRACYREPQNPEVATWKQRLDALHATRSTADWSDLSFLQSLFSQLSAEYKQAVLIENGQLTYDSIQSGALHSA